MQFTYTAKDNQNNFKRGSVEATDSTAAASVLRSRGLYPINVRAKGEKNKFFHRKVGLKDKIIFTDQLEIMIRSGLSIVEALKSMRDETENKYFAGQINQIVADVEGGTTLSEAMSKHPDTFNEIYINLVKSGERSGKVDLVLKRLSDQLEKDYDLTRKIRGALAYPAFVLVALIAVMVLVLIVVIPQLKVIFDDAGVELPLLTRIIIRSSELIKNDGLYLAGLIIILAIGLSRFRKTKIGRYFFDKMITKIPVIGILLKKSYMARFTRTFASLASSGLPLLEVFKVTSGVVGNVIYQDEINQMAEKVKNGTSVSKSLNESKLFPKVISQLAYVGERSGSLDEVFDSLANFFDRDVEAITSNLSTLLEPVILVIMGIGIGAVIVSVLQPIYGLVNAI
jgi:type IV pilus assembly protein PilC